MKLTEHIYLAASGCMGISPAGDCNVYAVESRGEIFLIDCGLEPSGAAILDNLAADGLNPVNIRGILLTHVHPDHVGAVRAFQERGIPVFAGTEGAEVLAQGIETRYQMNQLPKTGFRDFFCRVTPGKIDRVVRPGETVPLGDLALEAVPAPGHSPDSVCWLLRIGEKKHLFTGDTLFYPGHINFFTAPLSCPEHYPATIRRLAEIVPDGLYPGHALCTIDRGWQCTQKALEAVEVGNLPPIKPYS